jgi:adenylate cyclase
MTLLSADTLRNIPAAPRILGLLRRVRVAILGPPPPAVPDRVEAAVRAEQEGSEIVVGWVQVAAIVTFSFLYTLTPKAFGPNVMLHPVPWALGFYSLFTGVRLVLAYRRRLRPWLLSMSVVVDIAVLMVTIWSFHIQYQAPAAIYLKAPTLMYVFILIALRVLRYEPFYVLLAGATAALGWLVLLVYAVLTMGDQVHITHSYIDYITSYSILFGAEFDKMASLLMVTAILAVAMYRVRSLLVRTAIGTTAAADLARFFSRDVATQITRADMAVMTGQGKFRNAATMFVDLRGFTKLAAQIPPHAVIALLGEYQSRLVPVIEMAGGSIDKYLGDGIMASFGAARLSATYAADALLAVDGIMAAAAAWSAEREKMGLPAVRVGAAVAAGQVIFGAVGHKDRLEYTVIGDAVNLAAKLEKHTKEEKVRALTTLDAFDLAKNQGYEPLSEREIRRAARVGGVAEPLDLVVMA